MRKAKVVNPDLGRRVVRRRKARDLTQTELGKLAGISQSNIDSIEHGLVERPGRIFELAEALHTTAQWLLHEQGPEVVLRADPHKEVADLAKNVPADRLQPVIQLLKTLQGDGRDEVA